MRSVARSACLRRYGSPAGLVVAAGLVILFELRLAVFLVAVAGLGLGGRGLTAWLLPSRSRVDRLLATLTFAVASLAVVAEVLSLLVLLGSPAAWVVGATVAGVVGTARPVWFPPRGGAVRGGWSAAGNGSDGTVLPGGGASRAAAPRRAVDWLDLTADLLGIGGGGRAVAVGRGWPARLAAVLAAVLVLGAGLHLATVFVLAWFSGINIFDSLSHYMPRSVRFLQNGTFGVYATYHDYIQYLHQTVVAFQLLFLRSDILVNVTSYLAATLTSVGVFALARSLGWPAPYPLFAALVPLSMPLILLHASTSNFDTFTAMWLVIALYFLRRGFAGSVPGWLIAGAAATALAFASKPTIWFAVPGLGLLWLAALGRAIARRRLRRAAPAFAACVVVMVLVGMPFLLRNVLTRGYVVAPPEWQSFQLGGSASGPDHRVRLLVFNTFALGLQLLTPPLLTPARVAEELDPWFAERAQALGYRLPDPSITVHAEWPGLIRHVTHRYDSNHTGLGAAFVLVTLPSLLALPFARRRLGPRWWYAAGLALVGGSYFVVLNALSIYSVNNIRYLIEMMAALAALGPALFVLLPARLGGTLALAVSAILLVEMHDVVVHNKQSPPDVVTRVPRAEQYSIVNGNPPTAARAAAVFDQKYPPEEMPDVWIDDPGTPSFPDYTFQGPSLLRRTHYLRAPATPDQLVGPFLTRDGAVGERLAATGQVVVDQLGPDVWLLLPNDRPRVTFWPARDAAGALVLRLRASVPPGEFRAPRFGAVLRTVKGDERLREPEPSPVIDVPYDDAARGTIQVEIREGEGSRRVERIRIERPRYMGL